MINEKENVLNNREDQKSPLSRDTSFVDSSFTEMNEYMIKIKDIKYKEYIQKKYELMMKAFNKIDKDSNSLIDFKEMMDFLNEGKKDVKFDEEMAKKIFEMIDVNKDNQVSLSEFSKTYIQIEEELKMQILKLKFKYENRNNTQEKHNLDSQRFKNEILNDEGISNNAKIIITVHSLKYDYLQSNRQFLIKIVFKEEYRKTAISTCNRENVFIWNEIFEFKVLSQKHKLVLEVIEIVDNKEVIFGTINIPIDVAENQDEYECEIEIPEGKNGKMTGKKSEIKLKMQFIKSFYNYHVESAMRIEHEKKEILNNIQSIHKTIELLNTPFGFFEELNNNPDYSHYNYKNYLVEKKYENTTARVNTNIASKEDSTLPDKIFIKFENLYKENIGDVEDPLFDIIKYASVIVNIIVLLQNILTKFEFFSLVACSFILGIFLKINGENRIRSEFVKWCFFILLANIIYDLIYLIIVPNKKNEDPEETLRKISNFLFIICFILKLILLLFINRFRERLLKQSEGLLKDIESKNLTYK